jgi:hypothetical protein
MVIANRVVNCGPLSHCIPLDAHTAPEILGRDEKRIRGRLEPVLIFDRLWYSRRTFLHLAGWWSEGAWKMAGVNRTAVVTHRQGLKFEIKTAS